MLLVEFAQQGGDQIGRHPEIAFKLEKEVFEDSEAMALDSEVGTLEDQLIELYYSFLALLELQKFFLS